MWPAEAMAYLGSIFPKGARYSTLPSEEAAPQEGSAAQALGQGRHKAAAKLTIGLIGLAVVAYLIWFSAWVQP